MKSPKKSSKKEKKVVASDSSQGTSRRRKVDPTATLSLGEEIKSPLREEDDPELKPLWEEMDLCLKIVREEAKRTRLLDDIYCWDHDEVIIGEAGLQCMHCNKKNNVICMKEKLYE